MTEMRQENLFRASLNVKSRLKAALRQTVRESRFSREQIVDRMNARAAEEGLGGIRGHNFTLARLDGWLAESKGNSPDAELLPLICWAAEGWLPLEVLAASLGARVVGEEDGKLLDLARLEQEERRLAKRKRRLKQQIEGEHD